MCEFVYLLDPRAACGAEGSTLVRLPEEPNLLSLRSEDPARLRLKPATAKVEMTGAESVQAKAANVT